MCVYLIIREDGRTVGHLELAVELFRTARQLSNERDASTHVIGSFMRVTMASERVREMLTKHYVSWFI